MSTEHQVPSSEFWTITPFRFTTPDGWTARQTVDHLAYLERDDEPATNCGFGWKRISPLLELRTIAQMSLAGIRALDPGYKVGVSRYGKLHGRMSYLRVSEFTPPGKSLTGQVYSAFFGPSFGIERPIELFEFVGHFDAANGDRMAEISDILASFHFIVASTNRDATAGSPTGSSAGDIVDPFERTTGVDDITKGA